MDNMISIRITPKMKRWMKKKNKGPSEVFDCGLNQLNCPHKRKKGYSEK